MNTTDPYREGFMKLAGAYAEKLNEQGEAFFFQIGEFESLRMCLVVVYSILVSDGKCIPIEQLSEEQKTSLWEEAKRVSKSKKQALLIDVCKALHGLGTYIEMSL